MWDFIVIVYIFQYYFLSHPEIGQLELECVIHSFCVDLLRLCQNFALCLLVFVCSFCFDPLRVFSYFDGYFVRRTVMKLCVFHIGIHKKTTDF
jgi:hypothetical protein